MEVYVVVIVVVVLVILLCFSDSEKFTARTVEKVRSVDHGYTPVGLNCYRNSCASKCKTRFPPFGSYDSIFAPLYDKKCLKKCKNFHLEKCVAPPDAKKNKCIRSLHTCETNCGKYFEQNGKCYLHSGKTRTCSEAHANATSNLNDILANTGVMTNKCLKKINATTVNMSVCKDQKDNMKKCKRECSKQYTKCLHS